MALQKILLLLVHRPENISEVVEQKSRAKGSEEFDKALPLA
jgi:hypothetical protein